MSKPADYTNYHAQIYFAYYEEIKYMLEAECYPLPRWADKRLEGELELYAQLATYPALTA